MTHRTWIEVNRAALLHNVKEFFGLIGPKVRLMAVVKANAYGHGIVEVAQSLLALRSFNEGGWFGVDSLNEALTLRNAGITQPILTLGYVPLDRLHEAVAHDIRLTVYNSETIEALGMVRQAHHDNLVTLSLSKGGSRIKLHLKLETGTNRQGLLPEAALELCKLIQQYPQLELEGISSHFANIEDNTDHSFALEQLQRFKQALELLAQQGIYPKIRHMGASAATILMPETHFDMVRVGIGLYGLWPSRETFVSTRAKEKTFLHPRLERGERGGFSLLPVLSWKTRIAQIKKVPAGESVGYGLSERVPQDSRIAIIPVGYYDGYDRKLSSMGNVLIGGKRCKIVGRISMNMCMVDITHVSNAKVEDEVVLLGQQGNERIPAEELAQKIGTINYEVVARINPL